MKIVVKESLKKAKAKQKVTKHKLRSLHRLKFINP